MVCESGGGVLEGWRNQHGMPGETAQSAVTAVPRDGYVFTGWSDGVTEATRQDVFGETDKTVIANFAFDRKELPIISIVTASGRDVTSKDTYVGATVSICNTGISDYEMSGVSADIRGRGNATWTHEKKSYRIRFSLKQQPLGLGDAPDRSWILMANHCDQSLMRNALAMDLANRLDGIGFNSNCAHVELYLNGEYRGVYLLAEPIQVDAARVDIGEEDEGYDPMAEDAGFLVELDSYSEPPYDFRIGGKRYQVKSDVRTNAQFAYIQNYIASVENAVYSGDRDALAALVDLDSFVDGYLLEEYFKNIDVGWSSFYMYKKPGEKMVLGPFWDFDLAAGNDHRLDNGSSEGLYAGQYRRGFDQYHPWFTALTQYDWFIEAVVARWKEIRGRIDENLAFLRQTVAASPEAFTRNFECWDIFGQRINQEPEHIMALDSWEAHAAALDTWLTERAAWLDDCFSSAESFSAAVQSSDRRYG
ncbi:MAG: CotH kinase family protein, partial [Clostridia bacterium]|nr:CotH kinase family protein [Clostridia bacterium]